MIRHPAIFVLFAFLLLACGEAPPSGESEAPGGGAGTGAGSTQSPAYDDD